MKIFKTVFIITKIALQYVHSNSFYYIKKELKCGILIFAKFDLRITFLWDARFGFKMKIGSPPSCLVFSKYFTMEQDTLSY